MRTGNCRPGNAGQVKISGAEDFARVDRLKAGCDAVMVGIGTVLADDPSLTVKNPDLKSRRQQEGKGEHPIRVVIDSRARISPDASVLNKGDGLRVVVVSGCADPARVDVLRKKATVIVAGETEVDLAVYSTNSGRWESGASWWRAAGR